MSSITFFEAAERGDVKVLLEKLNQGQNIDAIDDRDQSTALINAIDNGHFEVAELLIMRGADVNLCSSFVSPLHFAVSRHHPNIVKLLLAQKGKIDVNKVSGGGDSALMWAHSDPQITDLLLKAGADYTITNQSGKTILDIIGSSDKKECQECLQLIKAKMEADKKQSRPEM